MRTFSTLLQQGTITLSNGETRAATAYRSSTDPAVTVTYVSGAYPARLRRRTATAKQAATFVAYQWRSYMSIEQAHEDALLVNRVADLPDYVTGTALAFTDSAERYPARRYQDGRVTVWVGWFDSVNELPIYHTAQVAITTESFIAGDRSEPVRRTPAELLADEVAADHADAMVEDTERTLKAQQNRAIDAFIVDLRSSGAESSWEDDYVRAEHASQTAERDAERAAELATDNSYAVELCSNCVVAYFNDDRSGLSESDPEPLRKIPAGFISLVDDEADPHFSRYACDGCGAIAGNRFDAVVS